MIFQQKESVRTTTKQTMQQQQETINTDTEKRPSFTDTLIKSGALTSMMDMYRYKSEVGQLQKIERDVNQLATNTRVASTPDDTSSSSSSVDVLSIQKET